jgi:hypothetical protein
MVHPWGSGRVYPNWPDPDLKDWARAYYGANYKRLVRVNATYYRGDFIRFRESLLSRVSRSGVPATSRPTHLYSSRSVVFGDQPRVRIQYAANGQP